MLRPVGHGSQDSAAQREQTREMTLLTGEQSLFLCSSTHTKVPALVLYLWELPFLSLSNRFNPFASLSPKPSISGAWNQSGAAELLRHTLGTRWEPTWRQGGQVRHKSPQATASCTVWTKITPRTQRMLELHETQQCRQTLLPCWVVQSWRTLRSHWVNGRAGVSTPYSWLPLQCAFLRAEVVIVFSTVQLLTCTRKTSTSRGETGFASGTPKDWKVCYVWKIYLFFQLKPSCFFHLFSKIQNVQCFY